MKAVASPAQPCVVQLGFAGARRLIDPQNSSGINIDAFHKAVQAKLVERLMKLRDDLHLSPTHFFCGISQIAAGADTIFGLACGDRNIYLRVFLPQSKDVYFHAQGSRGPDFTPAERKEAEAVLASNHVIQERVVSDAHDRATRFEDTNLEILRVSDVVICLLRECQAGAGGGTADLLDQAKRRHRPVLEIRVGEKNGLPEFHEEWHHLSAFRIPQHLQELAVSLPPSPDDSQEPPSAEEYCRELKRAASSQANWLRKLFQMSAMMIILTHIAATLLAAGALIGHDASPAVVPFLLGVELALLAFGFGVHVYLHRSEAPKIWATSRLVAEIARSVQAIPGARIYLKYLFDLDLPQRMKPLLRTLSVLHMASSRHSIVSWSESRERYIENRLRFPKTGQIDYYKGKLAKARRWHRLSQGLFVVCSLAGIAATASKLAVIGGELLANSGLDFILPAVLGALAIVMPMLAVASLSLAAAMDVEARAHIYEEMVEFLNRQLPHLQNAASEREFVRLLVETEGRLLGETAGWFSRRPFIVVG